MENNTFVTETDEAYVKRQSYKGSIIAFLIFTALSCLGFLVAWTLFAFFEVITVISCVVTFYQQKRRGHAWRLEFCGNELLVTNLTTQEQFQVRDMPASAFIITQPKNEIALDYCSFAIKRTVLAFGGVKNCKQLRAYMQENFD